MESKLLVSSRATIVCGPNGKFEFSNTTIVNVTGLDFIGCFENHVIISVGHFLMEHLRFYGEALMNSTVLTMYESSATLDRIEFISTANKYTSGAVYVNLSESCPTDSLLPDRATVVLSRKSITVVIQSWFGVNRVGLGGVIENYDSDITIFNTTFAENSAATHALLQQLLLYWWPCVFK